MKVLISIAEHAPQQWMEALSDQSARCEATVVFGQTIVDLLVDLGLVSVKETNQVLFHEVKPLTSESKVHLWIDDNDDGNLYITTVSALFWVASKLPMGYDNVFDLCSNLDKLFEEGAESNARG